VEEGMPGGEVVTNSRAQPAHALAFDLVGEQVLLWGCTTQVFVRTSLAQTVHPSELKCINLA
jgi:hypothetical protein